MSRFFALACFATLVVGASGAEPRPVLQFINGGDSEALIYYLPEKGPRVHVGTVAPGKSVPMQTTLGHRFAIEEKDGTGSVTVVSKVLVQGFRYEPGSADGIPAVYTQRADATGFPIVATKNVSPWALKEAVFLIDQLFAKRPDLRQAVIDSGARLCILAHNEFTTDLPEFARLGEGESRFLGVSAKDYWDARARGTGGSQTDPFCSCGEENLLSYPGDPYSAENILIHEFAHCVHLRGMTNIDPTFDDRLKKTWEQAMAKGLWKGKYGSTNHHEYFAEGVQSWFDDNRENDHDHNHVNTRAELIEYDPALAEMCREVLGDTELRYTKATTRLTGHLEGYDPSKAPEFVWPERLQKAKQLIRKAAESRSD